MKKFSKISGFNVNKPKEVKKEVTDLDKLKTGIRKLMDSYLNVRFYGPANRYSTASTMKVEGKDIFLDALLDYIEEFSNKDQIKLMESLKSESKDWELIDKKIENLKENLKEISNSNLIPHKNYIRTLIKKYNGDLDFISEFLESKKMSTESIEIKISAIKNLIKVGEIDKKGQSLLKVFEELKVRSSRKN
jgi:hypothetical protein